MLWDFTNWSTEAAVLAKVILIDIALAGDNAVVVGMAVAGLPERQRRAAILIGIGGATVLRILFGSVALRLLEVLGLTLAGGLLLLWVCWRMYRELRAAPHEPGAPGGEKSLGQAMVQIMIADLSMSLDNVLAVAGAAHGHPALLIVGLALSVVLMGVAATLISRLLVRHRWIGWVGLAIVLHVALEMIWSGGWNVFGALRP